MSATDPVSDARLPTSPNRRLSRYLRRITVTMAVLVAVTWGLGLFAIGQLGRIYHQSMDIQENILPAMLVLGQIANGLHGMRILEVRLMVAGADDPPEARKADLSVIEGQIIAGIRQFQSLDVSDEEMRLFMNFLGDWYGYQRHVRASLDHPVSQKTAWDALGQRNSAFVSAIATLGQLNRVVSEDGRLMREDTQQIYQSSQSLILVTLTLATILILGMLLRIVWHEAR